MDYDINALSAKLDKIKEKSKELDAKEKIKKYGTYLDSKQDIVQLYLLFMFFGVNYHTIEKFPVTQEYPLD